MRTAKLVFSSLALMLATTAAWAQSDGSTYTWSGAYVGLNAGAVVDGATHFDRTTGALPNNTTALNLGLRPTQYKLHDDGFIGGGQIGYNFDTSEMMGLVLGVEADAAYTDLDRTDTLSNTSNYGPLDVPSATPFTRVNQYNSELKYLGTVRGRLGFAFDQMMIYGTGGFAYGDVRRQITFYGPNAPTTPFFQGSSDGMKTGYTYGGGVEYAVPVDSFLNSFNFLNSRAITVKAEYLHYNLGEETLSFPGVNGGANIGGYTSRVRTGGDVVRAGINFKF